jgi:hypothetical protein
MMSNPCMVSFDNAHQHTLVSIYSLFVVWLTVVESIHYDAPPSSLLDPKRVQLCKRAKVVGTWCRS